MLKTVRLIKKIHLDAIIIVDNYKDYYVYDNDAYIVSYLTNLSVKKSENNIFIKNSINYLHYLIKILRDNNVNCIVVSRRHGYDVLYECVFDNNNYQKFMKKGRLVHKRKQEIIKIKSKLKLDILKNENKIKNIKDMIIGYV